MADDRVITLRFKPESVPDMELYRKLEAEKKRLGLSMPIYVKDVLRKSFEDGGRIRTGAGMDAYMEQMREVVCGELFSWNAAFTEKLERIAEGFPNGTKEAGGTGEEGALSEKEVILPEYSEEFPEGLEDILEKFL